MTGKGYNIQQRVDPETRIRNSLELSARHYKWGQDCPAVDLDFVLAEYNHGISVAIVDYKHHLENIANTNALTNRVLSNLYDDQGRQLPFFIARYWPDIWAFRVKAVNDRARTHLCSEHWQPMSEQQYVRMLYRLRKDALTRGDDLTIARLNNTPPPREQRVA